MKHLNAWAEQSFTSLKAFSTQVPLVYNTADDECFDKKNLANITFWSSFVQKGFGNIDGEYWLGLENIYMLTNQDNYRLLIELEDWSNKKVYAEYSSFRLEPESEFYRLRLGTYQGNAGDSMIWHNGKQFTTLDRDRDMYSGKETSMYVRSEYSRFQ